MIQSVDRAARILKALATGPGRLGVSELSARLGLAKGTVHGLLRTLHDHGLDTVVRQEYTEPAARGLSNHRDLTRRRGPLHWRVIRRLSCKLR